MSAAELYAFLSDIILQHGDVEMRFTNKDMSSPIVRVAYNENAGNLVFYGSTFEQDILDITNDEAVKEEIYQRVLHAIAFDGIQSGERLS